MYFAHSTDRPDAADWQTLQDHLVSVAMLAETRGRKFGAEKATRLAGLLHDLGRYTSSFQRRLKGAGEPVDHSSAGAQEVMRLVAGGVDKGMAELIAYAIAGHHAGLPDREGDIGSLTERWEKPLDPLDPIWREEININAAGLLPAGFGLHPEKERIPFQLGLLGRMIFSCLVDADFRDTEAFYAASEGRLIPRGKSPLRGDVDRNRCIACGATDVTRSLAKIAGGHPKNRCRAGFQIGLRTRPDLFL
jgi:CRISPR-associated endonuclease/helicase Cas3